MGFGTPRESDIPGGRGGQGEPSEGRLTLFTTATYQELPDCNHSRHMTSKRSARDQRDNADWCVNTHCKDIHKYAAFIYVQILQNRVLCMTAVAASR